jgi:hypothetical protein
MWWSSLLRNLADRIAPERLPALQLTSAPVDVRLRSGKMQLVRWSSLVVLPKVSLADQLKAWSRPPQPSPTVTVSVPPRPVLATAQPVQPVSIMFQPAPAPAHGTKLQSALSRSRLREAFLISVAAAEAVYLVASFFGLV